MVARDVAARGLDVKDIKYVMNYDFSSNIEDHVHRIDGTGRANTLGISITFFTPGDSKQAPSLIKVVEEAEQ